MQIFVFYFKMFRGHNNIVNGRTHNFLRRIDFTKMFVMSINFADVKNNETLSKEMTHTWVGISDSTAKSRKCKFVPSPHLGPFTVVASSRKSQTKVGTIACFSFLYQNELTM